VTLVIALGVVGKLKKVIIMQRFLSVELKLPLPGDAEI
jgi:hypothetical protein